MSLVLVLYFVAFLLLLLAAFGAGFARVAFGWLGLALWLFTAVLLPYFA
jgi:hypothetical protein